MCKRLGNHKGGGMVFWIFFITIIVLTWLASFLVKKTLETTNKISTEMAPSLLSDSQVLSDKTRTTKPTTSSPSGVSAQRDVGSSAAYPPSQQQLPKEIIYEPSIKDNILLQ